MSKFDDIFSAVKKGTVADVEDFLDSGVGVNIKDKYGDTPLYCAVNSKRLEMVKYLISRGADVNAEISGQPLLFHATTTTLQIVKFLVENGANIGVGVDLIVGKGERKKFSIVEMTETLVRMDKQANIETDSKKILEYLKSKQPRDNGCLAIIIVWGFIAIIILLARSCA